MKFLSYTIILTLLSSLATASVIINEIMYDPLGTDEKHEWIEIYSTEPINLSGWKLFEGNTNHQLNLKRGNWVIDGFAVIADHWDHFLQDYPNFNSTLFDSSWSSLSNKGEHLAILNSSQEIVTEINYSTSWGGVGTSLEKIKPFSNDTNNWGSSLVQNGTPGEQNSLYGSCDWSISVISEDIWNIESDKIAVKWKISLKENSNSGEVNFSYWIEDPSGEIIKSKISKTTNHTKTFGFYRKTFSNSGGYIIHAQIDDCSCRDISHENDLAKKPIIVTGKHQTGSSPSSSIIIKDISSSPEFGETINVKVNVYRGDTGKYAVYAYVETKNGKRVSEKTTLHVKNKFTNYTLSIPIQLNQNCNDKYKEGKHYLIIEGLGTSDKDSFDIDNTDKSNCGSTTNEKIENSPSSPRISYEITQLPVLVSPGELIKTEVSLENDNQEHQYKLWCYLFRGSKCYSCLDSTAERDEKKEDFTLKENKKKVIEFLVQLDDNIEEGEYKVKCKINKDNQKTDYELTRNIYIKDEEKFSKDEIVSVQSSTIIEGQTKDNILTSTLTERSKTEYPKYPKNQITGYTVYESSSAKAKNMIPYILIITFILLGIVLIRK